MSVEFWLTKKRREQLNRQFEEDIQVLREFQNVGGYEESEKEWKKFTTSFEYDCLYLMTLQENYKKASFDPNDMPPRMSKVLQDNVKANLYPVVKIESDTSRESKQIHFTGEYLYEIDIKGLSEKCIYVPETDVRKGMRQAKDQMQEWLKEQSRRLSKLAKSIKYCRD